MYASSLVYTTSVVRGISVMGMKYEDKQVRWVGCRQGVLFGVCMCVFLVMVREVLVWLVLVPWYVVCFSIASCHLLLVQIQ